MLSIPTWGTVAPVAPVGCQEDLRNQGLGWFPSSTSGFPDLPNSFDLSFPCFFNYFFSMFVCLFVPHRRTTGSHSPTERVRSPRSAPPRQCRAVRPGDHGGRPWRPLVLGLECSGAGPGRCGVHGVHGVLWCGMSV